jgi:hypothetical protein
VLLITLPATCSSFAEELIQVKQEAAKGQLSKLIRKESDVPFTLNDHYFTDT